MVARCSTDPRASSYNRFGGFVCWNSNKSSCIVISCYPCHWGVLHAEVLMSKNFLSRGCHVPCRSQVSNHLLTSPNFQLLDLIFYFCSFQWIQYVETSRWYKSVQTRLPRSSSKLVSSLYLELSGEGKEELWNAIKSTMYNGIWTVWWRAIVSFHNSYKPIWTLVVKGHNFFGSIKP